MNDMRDPCVPRIPRPTRDPCVQRIPRPCVRRIPWPWLCRALVLVCGIGPAIATLHGQSPSSRAEAEMMRIDGSRNPELIPQWNAWGYAFRIFAGGPRQLPSSVLEHVSHAEESLIIAAADEVQRSEARCQERLARIAGRAGVDKPDVLDREVRALSLECRTATLHARDRILSAINPSAQVALTAFVESTKAGTTLTIPKSQLARFREPE